MNRSDIMNLEILIKSDLEKCYSSNIIKCSNDLFAVLSDYKNYTTRSLNFKGELNSIIELTKSNQENYKSILLESNESSDSKLLLIQKDNITLIFNPHYTYYYILDKELDFIYSVNYLAKKSDNGMLLKTKEHTFDNKNLTYIIKNKTTTESDIFIKYHMNLSKDYEKYSLEYSFLDFLNENDIRRKLKNIYLICCDFTTGNTTVEMHNSPISIFTFDSRINLKEVTLDSDIHKKLNAPRSMKVSSYSQFLENIKDSVALHELGTDNHVSFFDQDTFEEYLNLLKRIAVDRKSYYDNEEKFKKILQSTYPLESFKNKVCKYGNQYKLMELNPKIVEVYHLLSLIVFSNILKENINSIINQKYIDMCKNKKQIVNNIKTI